MLDELDLAEQADAMIRTLSGGERRRAACGLELVGDPPVLLLDEPTSGLDAVLERRLMQLFRRLADHGRAVLVATHASASLDLCDEVVILQVGQTRFGETRHRHGRGWRRSPTMPGRADERTTDKDPPRRRRTRAARTGVRPFGLELRVLAGRYLRTLTRDRRTLVLLLGQAPLLGLLIALVFHTGAVDSANATPVGAIELVFLLMTGSIWLGVTSACREVVKERGLVEREFDVGVRLDAYVIAKALVLFGLNFVQVLWLTLVVVGLRPLGIGARSGGRGVRARRPHRLGQLGDGTRCLVRGA